MPSLGNLRRKRNRRTMSNNSSALRNTGRRAHSGRVHSGKVHSEVSLSRRSGGTDKNSTAPALPVSNGAAANGAHVGIGTLQG
jgi:hypothetical protein